MADRNNAKISAKANINEARGMFLTNDLTLREYNKVLKEASGALTPEQIQNTIKTFDNDFYSDQGPAAPRAEEGLQRALKRAGITREEFDKQFHKEEDKLSRLKEELRTGKKPSQNRKGGLPKKPKFMKGGSYKGKSHMYAAGGMVKELKM